MRYFYDCEFLEDGRTIDLISIGIVADDGRELYLVNADAPWRRIRQHDWLMEHVVPYLPRGHGDYRLAMPRSWLVDFADHRVMHLPDIAYRVRTFLLEADQVELWAYFGAYDHVVLAQLFGSMVDYPPALPMWTNDIQQLIHARRIAEADLPKQQGRVHNALDDARWVRDVHHWLSATATEGEDPS